MTTAAGAAGSAEAREPERELDRRIVRGSGWVAVSYGLRSLLAMLSMLALVRLLEPKAFGLVALASIFVTVVDHLQSAGVRAALIYRRGDLKHAAASGMVFTAFTGVAAFAVIFAAAPLATSLLHAPGLTGVLQGLALMMPLRGLASAPGAILERELDFRSLAKSEVAAGVAQVGLSIGLAAAGAGVWSLVIGQVGATGIQTLLVWAFVPWRPRPWDAQWPLMRELLGYGRFVSLGNIVGLVNETVGNVIIGRLLGTKPLGYYAITFRLADFPTSVIGYVVGRVMLPAYASVQDDMERFRRAFVQNLQRVALLSLPVGVGLAVGAEPIVRALLGESWLPVVTPLRILAGYSIVRSFASCAGPPFQALGKPHLVPLFALPQTIVTIPALILLTPRWGVTGAAISMLAGFAASGIPALVWAIHLVELRAGEFVRALAPSIACSGVLALTLGALLWTESHLGPAATLAVLAAAGLVVYVCSTALIARSTVRPMVASLRAPRELAS